MTKPKIKKALYITLAVAALILVIWGIVVKAQQPSTGTQQVMASSSSLEEVIRSSNTGSLSDDQFIYGVNNIIPKCSLSEREQLTLTLELQQSLQTVAGKNVTCNFLNWFGEVAAVIEIDEISDPSLLTETLVSVPEFKRVFINMRSKENGLITREAVFENGSIIETFRYPESLETMDKTALADLLSVLLSEFSISEESVTYSGEYLVLDASTVDVPSCLDLFDYTFRWLKQNKLNPTLVITKGSILLAAANLKANEALYDQYNTKSELSPLFHMTYYYTCNFLKNDLREQCQIYL